MSETSYSRIEEQTLRYTGCSFDFPALIGVELKLTKPTWSRLANQHRQIESFFRCVLQFYKDAHTRKDKWATILEGHTDPRTQQRNLALMRDAPLERLTPKFYRSDILGEMKLSEIQCPGSMWGQYAQLYDIASDTDVARDACKRTAHDILALGRRPVIHHLLDNSSMPLTMRYFIRRTMEHGLKYWGETRDVRYTDVNFVRSHSYFGLASENLFETKIREFMENKLDFDLPPISIFDQKIFYALPFDPETRDAFDDQARALFPYTALVSPEGISLPSGERKSIAQLFDAPRAERRYILKYAGMDTDRNWGSRAVHDLARSSKPQLAQLRAKIETDFPAGHFWVIQEPLTARGTVEFSTRDGRADLLTGRKELRAFYGPSGLMGALAIHRNAVKVHGADDSVFSLCRE